MEEEKESVLLSWVAEQVKELEGEAGKTGTCGISSLKYVVTSDIFLLFHFFKDYFYIVPLFALVSVLVC